MISAQLKGRIGNQLFQYAVCRCMATKLNTNYAFSGEKWLVDQFFDLKVNIGRAGILFKEGVNRYNDNLFNIKDGTHIDGYWQSEKYFCGFEDEIRQWFYMEDIEMNDSQCVIHFRAQDCYLSKNYTPSIAYFDQAKETIKQKNPKVEFLIVTDNINLAKKYFKDDVIVSNSMKKDFMLIKSAKYKILSNSTFSWWAAWLNLPKSKMIISPRRWMNYNYNKFEEDIFYPYDIKTKGFIYI
jgi:hypothetical protein